MYDCVGIGKMHFHPQRALHGFRRTELDESGRVESSGFVSDYVSWFEKKTRHLNILTPGMDWNGNTGRAYPYAESLHPTAWTAERAIHFLREEVTEQPFYLKISFARPHSPYNAPAWLFEHYHAKLEGASQITWDWDGFIRRPHGGKNEP